MPFSDGLGPHGAWRSKRRPKSVSGSTGTRFEPSGSPASIAEAFVGRPRLRVITAPLSTLYELAYRSEGRATSSRLQYRLHMGGVHGGRAGRAAVWLRLGGHRRCEALLREVLQSDQPIAAGMGHELRPGRLPDWRVHFRRSQ